MPSHATIPPPIVVGDSPALAGVPNKKRKIICFSDFDGTIFMQDTGHVLFDRFGCGPERRQVLDEQIRTGERSFRDVSEEMWGSLDVPFEAGLEAVRDELDMDPGFRSFHRFCLDSDVPFHVLSAGLEPVLRRVLDGALGEEQARHIGIVANGAAVGRGGAEWRVLWRHDTALGHDKALSIQEARRAAAAADGTAPLVVFVGDGVSDLPAAREADVLFARRGLRLEEYCRERGIAHTAFDTFADVRRGLEAVVAAGDARRTGGGVPSGRFRAPRREDGIFSSRWPGAFAVELGAGEVDAAAAAAVPEPTTPAVLVPAA